MTDHNEPTGTDQSDAQTNPTCPTCGEETVYDEDTGTFKCPDMKSIHEPEKGCPKCGDMDIHDLTPVDNTLEYCLLDVMCGNGHWYRLEYGLEGRQLIEEGDIGETQHGN